MLRRWPDCGTARAFFSHLNWGYCRAQRGALEPPNPKQEIGSQVLEDFRQRLEAAYDAWSASRGTTPAHFFDLMDEAIEFHSVLEREFPADPLSGPFSGKAAVIRYWTALAESWEML
ncbi:hypothetical protein GCM10011515_01690 [Tsuneonella deserti]|uniref:Uncharacterized protein n=1 Tax=Tsuneonella deserti TaxID=2035528 RepID=A0ABQ1RZT7_9SPHN|nr:hypothetical protein [Tsuneonella deserti]GGD85713.1 hypothetical protein GCM10011515_01690 [Tsuneonella deserti]